jgi:ATP dependent DNA ligase C terminal region/ATP dependent DNA ligase domain
MSLINRGRMEIKLGEYAVGAATVLADPLLVARVQDYRRHIATRMVPLEPEQILKRCPAADYLVSRKVDGEFNVLVYADGLALLANPGGTVRIGLPLIKEAADLLRAAGVQRAMIAGELYYAAAAGKRPRVHDVTRVARQPASQAELEGLRFAAFDVVEFDGKPNAEPYSKTLARLNSLFCKGNRCEVVETVPLKDGPAIADQHQKWVDAGAEGAVVRSETVGTFKIKTRHTLDAAVVGFTEGTDDRAGMVHDLLLAVMRVDGNLHILGRVGGGFSTQDRRDFLSDLKDRVVESDYVEVNDQVAYRMVRPELVLEISVLEMIPQTTRGVPIKTMVVHWNTEKRRYEVVRRMPLVSLTSPQFVRRREDKAVNSTDIRIQQVSDLVEVPFVDRDTRQLERPRSTILRREVRTKEMKGAVMVRKLVMWQTNKEADGDDYPAYVIHYTDYSPNRKTPLEREIRVSSSPDQIKDLWEELATEGFTKGWVPVGESPAAKEVGTAPMPSTAVAAADGPEPGPAKPARKRASKNAAAVSAEEAAPAGTSDPPPPPAKKRASSKKNPD